MFNKEMARQNDERILKMANYIKSNGTTRHVKGDMSVMLAKFAELKHLVKSGEFNDIDDLEDSVYSQFGIITKELDTNDFSDMMDEWMKLEFDEKKQKEDDGVDKKHT